MLIFVSFLVDNARLLFQPLASVPMAVPMAVGSAAAAAVVAPAPAPAAAVAAADPGRSVQFYIFPYRTLFKCSTHIPPLSPPLYSCSATEWIWRGDVGR